MTEKNFEQELIVMELMARQKTSLAKDRTLLSFTRTSQFFLVSRPTQFEVDKLSHVIQVAI